MTSLKLFRVCALGLTALLAGCATREIAPQTILQRSKAAYAELNSYQDAGKSVAIVGGTTFTTTFTIRLARTNLFRVAWSEPTTPSYTNQGVVWSAGAGAYLVMGEAAPQPMRDRETALSAATGISASAAASVPGTFFQMRWGNQLGGSGSNQIRQADGKVGKVACYVFTSGTKGRIKTLWIGKKDYLIHQVQTVTSADALHTILADAAKRNLLIHLPSQAPAASGIIATETHTDIVLNPKLAPADFER